MVGREHCGWPGRVRSTGRVAKRQEAAPYGFNCSSAGLPRSVCLVGLDLRHQEPSCPGAKCPGAYRFESGFACPNTSIAGVDLHWNPHGAASCRFATRPPYRDGRATRPVVARAAGDSIRLAILARCVGFVVFGILLLCAIGEPDRRGQNTVDAGARHPAADRLAPGRIGSP